MLALCAAGVPANAETVFDVIDEVTARHPAVEAASSLLSSAEAEKNEARSGYFPTLELNGRSGYEERNGANSTEQTTSEAGLSVTQPLFDGFQVSSQVDAADAAREQASYEVDTRLVRVSREAAEAYLEVLRTREGLQAAVAYRQNVNQILGQLRERARADRGLRADVTLGQTQQLQADVSAVSAETGYDLAVAQFVELAGRAPAQLEAIDLASLDLPVSVDDAIGRGETVHPAIKGAVANIRNLRSEKAAGQAAFFPKVELIGQARMGDDLDGIDGRTETLFGGVRLTYKFATGGADFYRSNAAMHRVNAAVADERDTLLQVRQQIREAWAGWETASRSYNILQQRRDKSRTVVENYRGQFSAGRRDLLDFLFVLSEQYEAERAEIDGRYDQLISAFRLLAAMGVVPDAS